MNEHTADELPENSSLLDAYLEAAAIYADWIRVGAEIVLLPPADT